MRGVLIVATLWGLAYSITVASFTIGLFLVGAGREPIRRLPHELADLLPMGFGMGALGGAMFAAIVLVAERRQTLVNLSEQRFRLWGLLAGALSTAAIQAMTRFGQPPSPILPAFEAILCGSFTGACFAPAFLRAAQRPTADASVDHSSGVAPV
jgi:ABC-type Fe3+-siderophore transport system permease subunit